MSKEARDILVGLLAELDQYDNDSMDVPAYLLGAILTPARAYLAKQIRTFHCPECGQIIIGGSIEWAWDVCGACGCEGIIEK
jgi:hypothetical protein